MKMMKHIGVSRGTAVNGNARRYGEKARSDMDVMEYKKEVDYDYVNVHGGILSQKAGWGTPSSMYLARRKKVGMRFKILVNCFFGKPEPGEVFIRGRIRRYSRAEI